MRVGAAVALLLALASGGVARAGAPDTGDDEASRLAGHTLSRAGGTLRIVDVAGEGAPEVGVVERRGRALWLVTDGGKALRLAGPLAVPRIAGPGYRVWALGRVGRGGALWVRRLGVLRRPAMD
ncbi:MAG TPA: hypothetical protein VMZ28_07845 [Kofleriaceae bacterium]|nr:hypothetical protein [Kofleriaceae bacterium]